MSKEIDVFEELPEDLRNELEVLHVYFEEDLKIEGKITKVKLSKEQLIEIDQNF
ncbi:MAG: hypothetical protein ACFFG0_05040 [Candidatus Thorarchaeota archaeon]